MLEDLEKDMVAKIHEQKENHSFELNEQIEKITNQLREEWEKENQSEFEQRLETQVGGIVVNFETRQVLSSRSAVPS